MNDLAPFNFFAGTNGANAPPAAAYVLLGKQGRLCRCPHLALDQRGNFWCCNDPTARAATVSPGKDAGGPRVGSDDVNVALHAPTMARGADNGEKAED